VLYYLNKNLLVFSNLKKMTHHMLHFCLVLLLVTSPVAATRFAVPKGTAVVNTLRGGDDKTAKWLEVCKQLAPVTSILCSMAPLPTIHKISETKSVGTLPLLPYSSMTANGFIWTLYGSLVGSPQGMFVCICIMLPSCSTLIQTLNILSLL